MSTDQTQSHPALGYLLAAGAAVMWGVSGVVARYLLGSARYSPAELLFFRTSLASLLLIAWLAFKNRPHLRIKLRDLPLFLLLGAIGLVANQGFYYLALSRVGVGYALLFQYLAPVLLMGYGVLSKTESMTGGKLLAAGTALAGCALMVLGQQGGLQGISVAGTLFAFGSGVGFAFYAAFGRYIQQRYSTQTLMAYAFLFAGLMWALINPVWALPWRSYDGSTWSFFIYLATIATVIPFGLFLASLNYLEPSRSSLTSMLEPVVAAVVAWIWLGETMGPWQVLGGTAVLGGVLLLQVEALLRARQWLRMRKQ